MTDVLGAGRRGGDAADRDQAPAMPQALDKAPADLDLGAGRAAVAARGARVCRHRVPTERLLLEREFGEHAADDRCGRLRRPRPGELALGGERHAADAGAAIARRLTDE